jgi:hypothetical protein
MHLSKNKYVPPSQRKDPSTQTQRKEPSTPQRNSKEDSLLKWIQIPKRVNNRVTEILINDASIFPTLKESINTNTNTKNTIMSFAAAAKYEEPKKEEVINIYSPGWVYIKSVKNNVNNRCNIEYKYEPLLQTTLMEQLQNQLKYEEAHDLRNLNSRIDRLQWDQDREFYRLGDLYNDYIPSIKNQLDNAYNYHINDVDSDYLSDNDVNYMSDH